MKELETLKVRYTVDTTFGLSGPHAQFKVSYIKRIYKKKHTAKKKLVQDESVKLKVSGDILDITATFELGDATLLGLDIGGNRIEYNVEGNRLQGAALKPVDGKVTIRVLLDRPMMEIIGNNGRVYITRPREIKGQAKTIEAFAAGGTAKLLKVEVNELESIWKKWLSVSARQRNA